MLMALKIQIARLQRLYGLIPTQARLVAGLHYGEGV
jgi:hypothetical protein